MYELQRFRNDQVLFLGDPYRPATRFAMIAFLNINHLLLIIAPKPLIIVMHKEKKIPHPVNITNTESR